MNRVSPNYWEVKENQRTFIDELAAKMNVRELSDWYKVSAKLFPTALLSKYENYHSRLLAFHFPDFEWCEWLFVRTPKHFWEDVTNRRRYMNWLGRQLNFCKMDDWYNITGDHFREHSGSAILAMYYSGCPYKAVFEAYPDYEWKMWLFRTVPDGFWQNKDNRQNYMQWLGERLHYTEPSNWYNLTFETLTQNNGYGVYHHFGNIIDVVADYLPDQEWYEWKFSAVSPNFWKTQENRHHYMGWLGMELGYTKCEDWYEITVDDFYNHCGGGLLSYYDCSPLKALADYMPNYEWHEWIFGRSCFGVWDSAEKRRRYMDWLGKQLDYKNSTDWYQISVDDFHAHSGGGFLGNLYAGSPSRAVIENYPEHHWDVAKFAFVPNGYWQKTDNRKKFITGLFVELGYSVLDDWYKCSTAEFVEHGGHGFLKYYDGYIQAIMDNYPEHDWKEWLFNPCPQGFWQHKENRLRYMNWLGHRLGFSKVEDWYKITGCQFEQNYGGGFLMVCYGGSPTDAVISNYAHDWQEWLFSFAPNGFWQDCNNRKRYMDWLGNQLGYKTEEDWYSLTKKRLDEYCGGGLVSFCDNSLVKVILDYKPDYKWDLEKFAKNRRNQKRVYRIIKEKWLDAEWEFPHPELIYKHSGRKMQVDIYIPSIRMVVEYHGEQHFMPVKHWGGEKALKETQRRDAEKREACEKNGIVLVEVAYTWDGRRESLMQQIREKLTLFSGHTPKNCS